MLLLHFKQNHLAFFSPNGAHRKNCSILPKITELGLVLFGAVMYGWGGWMKAGQSRRKQV